MEKTFLLSSGMLTIPCKLSQPDSGDIRRIVLGVHGFGGSTEDAIQVGIAEEMGLPLGTVKSRIFFARQKLQVMLKDYR